MSMSIDFRSSILLRSYQIHGLPAIATLRSGAYRTDAKSPRPCRFTLARVISA